MNLEELKKDCAKKAKERFALYFRVNRYLGIDGNYTYD